VVNSTKKPLLKLWTRDKGICWLCSLAVPFELATRDHVIPKSWGGTSRWSNLRLAHRKCNEDRAASMSDDTLMLILAATARTTPRDRRAAPLHGQENRKRRPRNVRMNDDDT